MSAETVAAPKSSVVGSSGTPEGFDPGNNEPERHDPVTFEGGAIARDKTFIFVLFFLLVVVMTFGGIIGSYIFILNNHVNEWRTFQIPFQMTLSTILIVVSSVILEIARKQINAENFTAARYTIFGTLAAGSLFFASQFFVWLQLVNKGVYMQSNPYAGFFYVLTVLHAVHVVGGIIALGSIMRSVTLSTPDRPKRIQRTKNLARSVSWYWHFMGALWIVLFVLLSFYR